MIRFIHGISFALKFGLAYYMSDVDPTGRPIERLMHRRTIANEWRDVCVAINGVPLTDPWRLAILADWDRQQRAYVLASWDRHLSK